MSIRFTLAATALAVLSTADAQAQGAKPPLMTVQKLYIKYCMAQGTDYSICTAYIDGVADEMRQIGALVSAFPADTPTTVKSALAAKAICAEDTTTNRAAVQAFKNWAQPNRKYWSEPAYFGVATALASTWPCPGPK